MEDTSSQFNRENTPPAGGGSNSTVVWFGITLIVGLLGLAAGLGLGSMLQESSEPSAPSEAVAELAELREQVDGLQADLDAKTGEALALAADLETAGAREAELRAQIARSDAQIGASPNQDVTDLSSTIAGLEEQLSNAIAQLDANQSQDKLGVIRESADTFEKHRLLLVEMRRDVPTTREEARAYWSNLKSIAADADPALVTPINRIILRIDNYFDWDERQPSLSVSVDDNYLSWLESYSLSGASEYGAYVDVFTKDAMLAIINQLDSIVTQLE